MNSVHLIGRLATDIDLKEVTGGSKVCSFILAVDRNGEEADFALLPTCGTAQSTTSTSGKGAYRLRLEDSRPSKALSPQSYLRRPRDDVATSDPATYSA